MKAQLIIATTAALALASSAALAATTTESLTVSAEVIPACSVSAAALAFPSYNPVTAAAVNGQGTISVTCTMGDAYEIGLGAGSGSEATVNARKMTLGGGTETLAYALYKDSNRSANWGNTSGTGADTLASIGTGATQPHTVYGTIAASQTTAKVGSYSDTVVITVTF